MRLNHFLIAFTLVALSACSGQAPQGIQVEKNQQPPPSTGSSSGGAFPPNPVIDQETLMKQQQLEYQQRKQALIERDRMAKQRLQGTIFNSGLQAISNCVGGSCEFKNVFQTMIQGIISANVFGGGAGGANIAPSPIAPIAPTVPTVQ